MKGYGLSVFRGTEPERFEVEVIDVLHDFRPDQDLILIRTEHPVLETALTVAGMSGSPIYLDGGRLAGAYAYGWPFGKEPVVGATPIDKMLEEMRRPVLPDLFPGSEPLPVQRQQRASHGNTRESSDRSPRLAGLAPYRGEGELPSATTAFDQHAERVGVHRGAHRPRGAEPASTPVMLGGFTDSTAAWLGDKLEPYGLVTLQTGGTGRNPDAADAPAGFVDGGPVGVQLIRGDVNATAIGTVTHVRGNKLVAFGHPMMNGGQLGLPTATAKVLHVLASQNRSFKIAEAIEPKGAMVHDRQSTIVVDDQLRARTIPVKIRVHGVEGAPKTEWDIEVASHRVLSPTLTFAALANAVKATTSDQTDVVFRAKSRVEMEGQPPVEVEDRGFMPTGIADARALGQLRAFPLMEVAFGNPFEETYVTRVDIDLHVRFARDVYRVVEAAVHSSEVDPGSTVDVYVTLQRLDEQPRVRVVPVRIPERAAGEEIELTVQPGDSVDIETPQPENVEDLVEMVKDQMPATSLVASLELPTRGLSFRGQVVRALPGSALDALQLANDSGSGQPFETQVRQELDIDEVLVGDADLDLQVREKPKGR
ncbi:MAG: hypothetical protein ACOCUS_03500 [Polyangiales bacterium]